MMNILGKSTINPLFYWSGKISGYFVMFYFFYAGNKIEHGSWLNILLLFLAYFGLLLVIISLLNLGSSARFGLPEEGTKLKTGGLYRISRNPLYFGFDLMTIAIILLFMNVWIAALGIYSIITYHFIILGEEKFLRERFGESYDSYSKKVRRYI